MIEEIISKTVPKEDVWKTVNEITAFIYRKKRYGIYSIYFGKSTATTDIVSLWKELTIKHNEEFQNYKYIGYADIYPFRSNEFDFMEIMPKIVIY
jgi:hypothetical protein